MKTCPYCAEEIEEAATRCRYCGRVLHPPTSAELAGDSEPAKQSVWKSTSIGAIVLTLLAASEVVARYPEELPENLLIGLPVIYLICWTISAGCVWLWRR